MKKIKENQKLKSALERMLFIAMEKLAQAKLNNRVWDISHYENDIKIIEAQFNANSNENH